MSKKDKILEGYVQIEKIDPVQGQTFEVVLLDGTVLPKNANEFLTEINSSGTVGGYCKDLDGFQNYHIGKNLVVVTGHMYKLGSYWKAVTSEVIPKEAISHFRKK